MAKPIKPTKPTEPAAVAKPEQELGNNPGNWGWVWNEYYTDRPHMQAAVWKNMVTGEFKKTPFRDIRNDKGQIQKNLLHKEGNEFGAKLNEPYKAWKSLSNKYDAYNNYVSASEQYEKDLEKYNEDEATYQTELAAYIKGLETAAEKAKAEEEARLEAEEKARIEAEEKARIEAEAEAERLRLEAEEAAKAEAERLRLEEEAKLKAEEEAKAEAERLRLEEETRKAEEARRAKEEEDARIAAEKARRTAEAQKVAQDRIEGRRPETYTPYSGEGASTYDPPGYEVGEAAPLSGPTSAPSSTADMPSQVFSPQYIQGAVPQTVSLPSDTTTGMSQTVMYSNELGQQIPVTEIDGKAVTYVPPGYSKMGMAQGGSVGYAEGGDTNLNAKYKLATKFLGYKGPKTEAGLNDFAKSNPAVAARMGMYEQAMAKGGMVRGLQEGGDNISYTSGVIPMFSSALRQTFQPMQAPVSYIRPTDGQFISPYAGQVYGQAPTTTAATVGQVSQAQAPTYVPASTYQAGTVSPYVQAQTAAMPNVYGTIRPGAQIDAAQQNKSAVSDLEAAQGAAFTMQNPTQRELQDGELISGVADAAKAAKFTEQIEAAQATPSKQATVQGQLEGLMQQFEGGDTPAWAAGAMRNAMGAMAARGLGASSLAGQAVVQAAMESALPIAQADAQTVASFEAQNLSNRQQRAMLAAQQRAQFMGQEFDQAFQARVQNSARIGDIANMNFTAEQNIALENSRAVNTMRLSNLNNRQAMVMAEAAALSQLDMANLSNRQQAAVQNAQNFLAMDMANLDRKQQSAIFRTQQNIQALFTDQAAENAAAQFNAANENQTRQFFSSLSAQTSQFNASQTNAINQFNVNSINAIREFNSNLQQQRDTFNATNSLVVAQANAQWRQNIATLNTAAQNESNREFAATINAMTSKNIDAVWQRERDLMSYNFTSAESAKDRAMQILLGEQTLEALKEKIGYAEDSAKTEFITRFLFGDFGGIFG